MTEMLEKFYFFLVQVDLGIYVYRMGRNSNEKMYFAKLLSIFNLFEMGEY